MSDGVVIKLFEPSAGLLPAPVEAFAIKSWLVGYEPRARRLHRLDRREYFGLYHPALTTLLRSNRVALAVAEDDEDAFVGFACGVRGVLHYVYVKHPFRLLGQGGALVRSACEGEPSVYTFEPPSRNGRPRASVVRVAARKGWRYHAHPVPGVVVRQQQRAREETHP
jgi:hypothetical protein